MSYEGYDEYLCERGHYSTEDCYGPTPHLCMECHAPIKWWHSVDCTNGVDENDPGTQPASLIDDGFDDIWKFDHYGQRYAQKRFRYRPGPEWKLINEQAVSLFRSES